MRSVCPTCQAAYEIPDHLLGAGGKRLRCARCAGEWLAAAPVPVTATADPAPAMAIKPDPTRTDPTMPAAAGKETAPVVRAEHRPSLVSTARPEIRPAPPVTARPRRGAAAVAFAWLLSFAVLGGAAAGAYHWRAEVMVAWPPSQRLYAALGVR